MLSKAHFILCTNKQAPQNYASNNLHISLQNSAESGPLQVAVCAHAVANAWCICVSPFISYLYILTFISHLSIQRALTGNQTTASEVGLRVFITLAVDVDDAVDVGSFIHSPNAEMSKVSTF